MSKSVSTKQREIFWKQIVISRQLQLEREMEVVVETIMTHLANTDFYPCFIVNKIGIESVGENTKVLTRWETKFTGFSSDSWKTMLEKQLEKLGLCVDEDDDDESLYIGIKLNKLS